MELLPRIQPAALKHTSPTGAEALRTCFLRAAFASSPLHRNGVMRGPSVRIGSVCHRVLEAISRGAFDNVEPSLMAERFDELWQREIEYEEQAAQQSTLERHFGPANRWPYYALRRAYAWQLTESILETRRVAHGIRASATSTSTELRKIPQSERQYVGFGGLLQGRADQVIQSHGRVEIVDYKSGTIYEEGGSGEQIIRPEYRRQLLLYAALHWDQTGAWPAAASLISLRGERASIDVDPSQARALVDEALNKLTAYNVAVRLGGEPEALARPSQSACLHCPFKAACPAFWSVVEPWWEINGSRAHVSGIVTAIDELGHSGRALNLAVERGSLPAGHYRLRGLTQRRFSDINSLVPGTAVRVIEARVTDGDEPHDLLPSDYTELWWESATALGGGSV